MGGGERRGEKRRGERIEDRESQIEGEEAAKC
jgi:hypothetical protein